MDRPGLAPDPGAVEDEVKADLRIAVHRALRERPQHRSDPLVEVGVGRPQASSAG
jgi:hypothetical protein